MADPQLTVVGSGGERHWSRRQLASLAGGNSVPVSRLLDEVGAATHASFETASSDYRASIPLDVVVADGVIVHGDEEGPLDASRGGPFRLLVPDGKTLCWNVKNVARIRLTVGSEPDSVPANPPH
ncbi:MAG: molybdopterin-dependent oxidoreductase [Actinomycetota bacterium]|nr:molybdopterin-dependent oxidoreductase [Actinomycetota bacterium]